jgi:hypothetical protein
VAPAAEADELLCDLLLALSDDAWSALAAAFPASLPNGSAATLATGNRQSLQFPSGAL